LGAGEKAGAKDPPAVLMGKPVNKDVSSVPIFAGLPRAKHDHRRDEGKLPVIVVMKDRGLAEIKDRRQRNPDRCGDRFLKNPRSIPNSRLISIQRSCR
jgi:hypothetical protein